MTFATARNSDPSTSHEAAERLTTSRLEATVYGYLLSQFPRYMTTLEIAAGTGIDKWSISPRMRPLRSRGLLEDPITKAALNSTGKIRNLQHWCAKDRTK